MVTKVAILTHRIGGGGTERVISRLSFPVADRAELTLLLLEPGGIGYSHGGDVIGVQGPFETKTEGRLQKLAMKPVFILNTIISTIKVRSWAKQNKIDVLISFLPLPNLINVMSGRGFRKIASVRNHMTDSQPNPLVRLFVSFTHRLCPLTVAVSKVVKQDLIENFGADKERVRVIYNPIPIDSIEKSSDDAIEQEDSSVFQHPVLINVARLTPAKGQEHLIRSFAIAKESLDGAKLVLIGSGPSEECLKSIAIEEGIADDVIFLGHQDNPFKFLSRSSVFVLSSLHEGFPNAMLEAMACGIPIVSTDCRSGPREILSTIAEAEGEVSWPLMADFGILVPSFLETGKGSMTIDEKYSLLAEAMAKALDPAVRDQYITASRARAEDFRMENILPQWLELIFCS